MTHPVENLVRLNAGEAANIRSASNGEPDNTLFGHFAVFEEWTEINSVREGRFMERVVPGAFKDTLTRGRDRIKVLYDHGQDPSTGNKPLGVPLSMEEDTRGAAFEVELFDVPYVNELKPAIKAGQMGSSFRFSVRGKQGEQWVKARRTTDYNPNGLDERTITAVDVFEFGPVTFPAYAEATSGLRSMTDQFFDKMLLDPAILAAYIDRVGSRAASKLLAGEAAHGAESVILPQAAHGAEGMGNGRSLMNARAFVLSNRRKRVL